MLSQIYSAAVLGVDAYEVEIEVNAAGGSPSIVVVGLPDTAVKESKDRVTTAVANSGYFWPRGRTTINLAPADVKKEGPSFDLPIALGMTAQEIEENLFADFMFVGELAPNGGSAASEPLGSCGYRSSEFCGVSAETQQHRRSTAVLLHRMRRPSQSLFSRSGRTFERVVTRATRRPDRFLISSMARFNFCKGWEALLSKAQRQRPN